MAFFIGGVCVDWRIFMDVGFRRDGLLGSIFCVPIVCKLPPCMGNAEVLRGDLKERNS